MQEAVSKLLGTPRRRMVALLAFVNLSVFALVWVALDSSYRQYQDRAAIASRNTNRLVAQSIAGDIERIDLALQAVVDEAARLQRLRMQMTGPEADAFLTRLQSRLPMANSVRVSDANGNVLAGSSGIPAGVNIGDRDYFIRLRDESRTGLVISAPVLGRISGKAVLIFARRLDAANGGFAGLVYSSVTVEWFDRKFEDLDVGPSGAVVLRGDASRDFDLLARFPKWGFVGQTKVSSIFRGMITANPQGGTYEANAGSDNIHRTFSYEPVDHYPLITLVGLATSDYLGEWWRDGVKVVVLAVVFSMVTVIGGVGMLRSWRVLEQRTEELARSNADLEQFAFIASHDLQTPLRNITSYAQLLHRRYLGRLDSDADEFINFIVDSAKHMSAMIPDLLNYARVSTTPAQPVPVELTGIVEGAVGQLAKEIEAAGAKVRTDALPVILAEPGQIESLFQHLIENAITYCYPGRPPRVKISAEPAADGFWRIAVQDNGIGIAPEYHEKIFAIFQRLEPSRFPGGTGIGLPLCRRIVHRFGGTIWVESKLGQGTTFFFTLRGVLADR